MTDQTTRAITTPLKRLNNGIQMPALGLGTYQSPRDQTAQAVESAIASGYRLIDTAEAYGNESEVGQAIARSSIPRSELFVIGKLWITHYGYEPALQAFETSLNRLGLEYLDLYLLHWPVPSDFGLTVGAYKAAERLLADGRVRAIGVCNFKPDHLQNLVAQTEVMPAVNQVELHPFFSQRGVRDWDTRHGVHTQAWSPIGGIYINHPKDRNVITRLVDDPRLVNVASKHGKTPAQVVLRWHLQHGVSAIPKSVHADRIAQNIDIFDFELDDTDMAAIDHLDTGRRAGGDPDLFDATRTTVRLGDGEQRID
jgi:diketogulonate reductase-like aldo/keto reductase